MRGPRIGEGRRQQRERRRDREADHDGARDAHRAKHHEVEQEQPGQAHEHGHPTEEDRPPGCRNGGRHRVSNNRLLYGSIRTSATASAEELLATATDHQQGIVDTQAEAQQGREIEHEDAHGGDGGDQHDGGQRDEHRQSANDHRHARGHDAAEDEQERDRGERQADELAPTEVILRDRLDVPVERGTAGQRDVEAGLRHDGRLDRRQGVGGAVRRQVERDDLVHRPTVRADLVWCQRVGQHPRHVAGGRDPCEGSAHGGLERWVASSQVRRGTDDDDERRRWGSQTFLEQPSGARRLEVIRGEAARLEHARCLGRERQRHERHDGPSRYDPPAPAGHGPTQSFEGAHRDTRRTGRVRRTRQQAGRGRDRSIAVSSVTSTTAVTVATPRMVATTEQ